MRRREFVSLIGAAAAWPIAARAQQAALPLVGFLNSSSPEAYRPRVRAFQQGLAETGFTEGRNLSILYRWANEQNEKLPALAADLVRRNVSAIAAGGTRSAVSAKEASSTIPVIFHTVTDPVAAGLVMSLSRPTANLTGITSLGVEIGPKRLELMRELMPQSTAIALLINPTFPGSNGIANRLHSAAQGLGLRLHVLKAASELDFDAVFVSATKLKPIGLVMSTDPLFTGRSSQLAAMALRFGIPAIYQYREFAAAGGLLSYGESFTDSYRLLGIYTGRILNGEKVADLPVQQSAKVELILNLKTAKALGLNVPLALLGRADEVIE
jgi:putative tryptophan/tyrosine transport system substrate-binding protein